MENSFVVFGISVSVLITFVLFLINQFLAESGRIKEIILYAIGFLLMFIVFLFGVSLGEDPDVQIHLQVFVAMVSIMVVSIAVSGADMGNKEYNS
jgi:heme/copper-type cytochrome/quinol oxidase subunit 4